MFLLLTLLYQLYHQTAHAFKVGGNNVLFTNKANIAYLKQARVLQSTLLTISEHKVLLEAARKQNTCFAFETHL